MPQAMKEPTEARTQLERNIDELRRLLKEKGLLKEEGRQLVVDISRAKKEYLPKEYWGKTEKITFARFESIYTDYQPTKRLLKPNEYIELLYGKTDYKERYIRYGGETTIPITLDKIRVGAPVLKAGVGYREEETRQQDWMAEAGVAYENKKVGPAVSIEKGGFFANIVNTIKNITVGIVEGVFSIAASIKKGIEYAFSVTLGPWIGKLNLGTGHVSGVFSWIAAGYEMFKKGIERALGEDTLRTARSLGAIREGAEIKGRNSEGREVAIQVSKITKKSDEKVYFTDRAGREYVAKIEDDNLLHVKEDRGFFKIVGQIFNPLTLLRDAVDVAVKDPIKKAEDVMYTYRKAPDGRKLSEGEKKKYEEKMRDAIKRENYNTARYAAKLLIQSPDVKGAEKAGYMLTLDDIEWAMAYKGFFVGYISGLGFGNRKKMVQKSIESRVRESMGAVKTKDPSSQEFACAAAYLGEKASFVATRTGKQVPSSPLSQAIAREVFEAVSLADKRAAGGPKLIAPAKEVKVNFVELVELDTRSPEYQGYMKFLLLLQRVYEYFPQHRDDLITMYGYFTEPLESKDRTSRVGDYYEGFRKKMGNNFEAIVAKADKLGKSELKEAYEKGMGKTKSA